MSVLAPVAAVGLALSIGSAPMLDESCCAGAGAAFAESDVPTGNRNERSTPRDAILPFSPAIAPREPDPAPPPIAMAKAVLLRLGYDVGRLDDRVTARFKVAVFQFQRTRGLSVSGELDPSTLSALGLPPG